MAYETKSMEDFLGHRSSERGGSFLGNWKKDKKVTVFLHTKQRPVAVWRHNIPRLVVREEKQSKEISTEVWSGNPNCWEDESILRRQRYRNDDGSRKYPPVACPICLLQEAVRKLIDEKKLGWTQPLFKWCGDDPSKAQVMHAGGFCGEYGGDLDDAEKALLKKAGISLKESWKENASAKMSYIFYVVDADDVPSGVQTAIETALLGDKVKDVIADAVESRGSEKGNPEIYPYAIQWEYRPDEVEFGKRYAARLIERVQLTPEIERLIRGPKPDFRPLVEPFKRNEMRADLEKACYPEARKVIPWDEVFERPRPRAKEEEPSEGRAPEVGQAAAGACCPECGRPEGDEQCPHGLCDECDKLMVMSDPKCPHCGHVYEVETAPVRPPPPPPPPPAVNPRRRSSRKADKPEASAPAAISSKSSSKSDSPFEDDEIPF